MKTYCKICPRCGANLDPGERCECADRRLEPEETAKATPPGRRRDYIIGVDLARGKDFAGKAFASRQ